MKRSWSSVLFPRLPLATACGLALYTAIGGTHAPAQVPADFDKKAVFSEEFSGNALDASKWEYRSPGVRNNCVDAPSAVKVAHGHLTITTYSKKDGKRPPINYCAMISTEKAFSTIYGYWEASVRFHAVNGFQCAFWSQSPTIGAILGNPQKSGVEMDIFEHLAEAGGNEYDHALHWDGYGTHHAQRALKTALAGLDDGTFHRFAMAWRPSGYTFYVDGKATYHVPSAQAPVSHTLEYIILSTEVPRESPPSGFGGRKASLATFEVDYVRVYPYRGPTADSSANIEAGSKESAQPSTQVTP